ncbi:MAG: hypothetical protein WAM58_12200, partial [Candidatus Acidiferrum sp.]
MHKMRPSAFGNGLLITVSLAVMCPRGAWAQDAHDSPNRKLEFCAQEEKPGQQRVWKVKESSTRLWIAEGMLVSATAQEVPKSIPLSGVKSLAYEITSEHPAAGEISAWAQDLWDAAPDAGEAAGFIIFPLAAGAAIPSLFLPLKRTCQFRLKIPLCTGWKFPTPELHEW